uniref:Uncharacterized protein n=1 Tax=Aegilops tauschii subsp. strangulata TaxID=200361 RepID=A0A453SWE8_AEGTS
RLFSSSGALLGRLPPAPPQIRNKVVGCRGAAFVNSRWLHDATQCQTRQDGVSRAEV